jgi:hypothetical protein
MLVLKLRCDKRSASTERTTLPFIEEEAVSQTHKCPGKKKNLDQKSRPVLKTRMTAGESQEQFIQPTDRNQESLCWRMPASI